MTRPTIAPETLARYEEQTRLAIAEEMPELEQLRALAPKLLPKLLKSLEEVGIAGGWLMDELLTAGATEEAATEVTMAHGQASLARDPWAVAEKMLVAWRAGRAPTPGLELAERLLTGDVSDLPPGGLRLRRRGVQR